MKAYSRVLFAVLLLMLAGILVFAGIAVSYRGKKADVLLLNDLAQAARENWDDIAHFDGARIPTQMRIWNSDAFLVFQTEGNALEGIESPEKAMQEGCFCLSIHDGSRFLGTIAIPDPAKGSFDTARRKLIAAAAVLMLVILLVGALYGVYAPSVPASMKKIHSGKRFFSLSVTLWQLNLTG